MNFWIQASNPRSVRQFDEEDHSVSEALETVFPLWAEEAILVWHHVHVPLSYKSTISFMIDDILSMLDGLMRNRSGNVKITWPSNEFAVVWHTRWENNHLEIRTEWNTVIGFTESLLAARSTLNIDKNVFVCEWKQVLGITLNALLEAGYRQEHLVDMSKLQRIYEQISEPGILYK
jgi:hypothetical protein